MEEKPLTQFIYPDNPLIQYTGRIDVTPEGKRFMVYPCSSVTIRFFGRDINITLENHQIYCDNYVGVQIDGKQSKIKLTGEGIETIQLANNLEDTEHTVTLFKRMDGCHAITFHGFTLNTEAIVLEPKPLPKRRIEVYGDSVSAGEVSEAIDYVGKEDPNHNGEYSNSWYSYAWMTARKLDAQIHNISQGGIALLDKTGWFHPPEYIGMESAWDKVQYVPEYGEITKWKFNAYIPHVVIVAVGQNDNHPEDYMKDNYLGNSANKWRKSYYNFIMNIREKYSKALIILTTTILVHDKNWDLAIEQICKEIKDDKVVHFLFSKNGCGTPGHIRISEAEGMAEELSKYIESFGPEIWKN